MTQPQPLSEDVLDTILDESQIVELSLETNNETQAAGQKPEGETVLTIPDLPVPEPVQKKARVEPEISTIFTSAEIPTEFRVKWIKVSTGLVPFAMNEATGIVHCGKSQMKVFTIDGSATVLCLRGCHWNCPGHQKGHCGCHCNILQWHYNTR